MKENIISRLGDASYKFFTLLERAAQLAATAVPDMPEGEAFIGAIREISKYLASYGFTLVIILSPEAEGCRMRIAMRDNALTHTIQ